MLLFALLIGTFGCRCQIRSDDAGRLALGSDAHVCPVGPFNEGSGLLLLVVAATHGRSL